jgi:alpha-glucosidase (family GH31 glycosyl hydrolase)
VFSVANEQSCSGYQSEEFYEANRQALQVWVRVESLLLLKVRAQERHELTPYLYNAMWELFRTGVQLLRPMYYYYPLLEEAYLGDAQGNFAQYFFGRELLVAPIVSEALNNDTLARKTVWIPPSAAGLFDSLMGTVYPDAG